MESSHLIMSKIRSIYSSLKDRTFTASLTKREKHLPRKYNFSTIRKKIS
mgnify:CR=1 FL=1